MHIRPLAFLLFALWTLTALGQNREWTLLHQGNRAYRNGAFPTAERHYQAAQKQFPHSAQAAFNLGDALLAQKKTAAAMEQYQRATQLGNDPRLHAMAHHNIGVIHHQANELDQAIEAYKTALRYRPEAEDTRHNLALALRQRRQQSPNTQNQQQQKNANQPQQKKNQQPPRPNKNNADQMLHVSQQAERQTRAKVEKARIRPPRTLDKNW